MQNKQTKEKYIYAKETYTMQKKQTLVCLTRTHVTSLCHARHHLLHSL